MYVFGIEAVKQYLPSASTEININIKEERVKVEEVTETMSSIERYKQEWANLLKCLDQPEYIRNQAFNRELKVSKFRSLYWALLLRVLNTDYESWSEQRDRQRNRYEKLKQDFLKNPRNIEMADDNPLSQSQQSVWNQYFSDQELFAVIRQDVVRTFPGVDFFRKSIIQISMCNILFYYAREHPYMCYRQGMHEILAPILFVIYSDHQSLLHFNEISKTTDEILFDVINPSFLEADSYSIFTRLMSLIEPYYRITNFVQNQSGYFAPSDDVAQSTNAEVISQLNFIRENIFAKEDLHLHNYLLKLEIPLHIFGIRWLRLLFGREFSLLDLLVVWDAIFADSDRLDLPNYILVAMLIRIRDKLLLSDQTACLTYLMRYPANMDVNLILCHALHMLMPKKFDMPPNVFVYFTENKRPFQVADKKIKDLCGINMRPMEFRPTHLNKTIPKINEEANMLQVHNAADVATTSHFTTDRRSTDACVMEGYSKNSPELLLLELKNAQTIMSIAQSKLQSYLTIIRKHISNNNSSELNYAIDGMEELCNLLHVKCMLPLFAQRTPIDEALEANEQIQENTKFQNEACRNFNLTEVDRSERIPTPNVSAEITATNNQSSSYSEDSSTQPKICNYERPEDFYLSNSSLLGNLREIELITIIPPEQVVKRIDTKFEGKNNQWKGNVPISNPLRHCENKNESK